jgi:hypothetical protein
LTLWAGSTGRAAPSIVRLWGALAPGFLLVERLKMHVHRHPGDRVDAGL